MAPGGCVTCVKYTLFVFNFIFWLVGCLLLAVGIWALVDPGPVREHADDHKWEASLIVYSMITVGSIMTIIGFLGCCGAIRGSRCLLTLFFIMLFVIHGIFLSVGLYLAIERDKVSVWLHKPQKELTSKELRHLIENYESDPAARKHMKDIQQKYKCCGADQGLQDYRDIIPALTEVVCRKPSKPCTEPVYRAEVDRHDQLSKELPKYAVIVSAVILSISFLMIIGMILSIVLYCALKNELINPY